jgi:hypothetical protein
MNDNRRSAVKTKFALSIAFLLLLVAATPATAQLNENCTVSVLNRSVQVARDGSWILPNVPANVGFIRARATCVEAGVTRSGQSDYFLVPPNGDVDVAPIQFATAAPIAATLVLTAPVVQLGNLGATVQVTATATYANGTSGNLSLAAQGTNWFTSNPRIATVSPNGLVTAVGTGNALISSMNEGALGMLRISILTGGDLDGDGLPDDFELANGLDPNNPADAAGDLDGDGLSNLEEFRNGTLLNVADSDGDGLLDGAEIAAGTNPLLADTDGDGIRDGLEVQTGSNPLDPLSFNLAQALQSITVAPDTFEIVVNTLIGEGSRIVAVTGNLRDGTTIDLTARNRGTTYSSSNLAIVSFGVIDGQLFGGTNGTATVTIANAGHTATATATVRNFTPQQLAFLRLPGFANNVDVAGNYAYIASGGAGLVVIDVTNRSAPSIVATLDTPGNANDVRVANGIAYVADGASGLQIIDVSSPTAPRILGTLDTADAWDVSVAGGNAYVADGSAGLKIIDVRNAAAPVLLGTLDTSGTAKGVDVAGNFAIVADGGRTLVIDVTVPTVPTLAGSAGTTSARDVVAQGTLAYVADYDVTLRVIDFSNPASPQIVGTANRTLAGIPTDVAKARDLVFLSDVFFVNGVSITDVRSPSSPTVRARLDFTQRDDNGTGIAVDHQFVYLTAERGETQNGVTGDTALYIGQYLFAEDTAGIAPTVRLTSPVQQPTAIEGGTVRIAATATDDMLVADVEFLVNDEVVSTDSSEPYEFLYRVPPGIVSIAIQARATDIAGNSAITPQVIMSVIPDPGTTVFGVVVVEGGAAAVGANVSCLGRTTVTTAGGNFSVGGVPAVSGTLRCTASFNAPDGTPMTGTSNAVTMIAGGNTSIGTLTVRSALGFTKFPMSAWQAESKFRASTIAREGNTLVLAKYGVPASSGGGSEQFVLLDLTDPARPAHLRTVRASVGATFDLKLNNGWAYIAGHDFCTFQFSNPAAVRNCVSDGFDEWGVAFAGGYAYTATASSDGRLRLYDVSNPALPRYLREQSLLAGVNFRDLELLGTRYVVGISPDKPNGVGHDVVVIDIRDANSWTKIADLDIPNFDAFRGHIRGNTLYLAAGNGLQETVIVDLSTPTAPAVLGRRAMGGNVLGVYPVDNELFVAAGATGFASLDISTPASPVETRAFDFGSGIASDVTVANSYAYVANETELAVVGLALAPQIDIARIVLERDGSLVTVRGAAGAITGQRPLTMGATNATTNASVSGIAVASDGSFTASITAASGDPFDVTAVDVAGRTRGPIRIGVVPFGNATFLPLAPAATGGSFRARTLAADGSMLVVTNFSEDYGLNPNAAIYDISNPSAPVYRRTTTIADGHAYDVQIVNGWAYVGGHDFCTINLANPSATRNCISDGFSEIGVAVSGLYAFTGTTSSDGRLRVYDVATPSAPRYLYERSFVPGVNFHDVIALGNDYLIGISPQTPNGVGHDVVVFSRRDVNNIVKIADLDIPAFNGNRGRIYGNRLYLASNGGAQSAIVDLSNPSTPSVISVIDGGASTRGIDLTGNTIAVANGSAGVTMYDATNAAAPVSLGTQFVGGSAWDVLFNGGALYVANELGIAVIAEVSAPPAVDTTRISVALVTSTSANVIGQARAISGVSPLTVELRNTTTGASTPDVTVAGDGSFSGAIAARPGELLAVLARDGNGRITGPVSIGPAPFGSGTSTLLIPPSVAGNTFRARTLASEGNLLVVTGFSEEYGTSPKGVVFDISNPASPVLTRTVDIADGHAYDVDLKDGWAYVGGHDFCTINLANPSSTRNCISDGFNEIGVAVSGGFAVTSTSSSDGRLRVYDVSNPAAPRYLYERSFVGGINFHDVIAFGSDYLVATSPHATAPGNVGHDVVVFDRRNVNDIVKIADLDIPGFTASRGRIYGNTLYLASNGGGAMAIVDLSNPAAPQVLSMPGLGGYNRGVSAAGSVAATADGALGVTFLDVANPAAPAILGRQFVGGNAWDALFSSGSLYVANEHGIVVIQNVVAAPIIDKTLIIVTPLTDSTASVSGLARAITGASPITVEVRNDNTNASVPGIAVAADGSVNATIGARAGEVISVIATDANGRTAGPVNLGGVPFGSTATTLIIPRASVGNNFRARTLATEGNLLVVTGFSEEYGPSPKGVVYDISNPASPALTRVVDIADGHAYDIELENGWALVGGHDFCTINLGDPASVRNCVSQGFNEIGVAAVGGYAITGTSSSDGRLRVFDVSNRALPRYLYERSFIAGVNFHDVIAYGSDYLIGITPHAPGGTGHDVVIFDSRNINDVVKVIELAIPNFNANRGRVYGNTLYVASDGGTSMAIVDLTDPRSPQLRSVVPIGGRNRGVSISGTTAVTADGAAGVTFIDVADPSAPAIIGRQFVGGNAWDTALSGGTLYVANEHGIVVIPDAAVPPIVDLKLVGIQASSATESRVTGVARAATGTAPLTVEARNATTGSAGSPGNVGSDGAFTTTAVARPGDVITLVAIDGVGRVTTRDAGNVPFGSATSFHHLAPAIFGDAYRARTLAHENNILLVLGYRSDYGVSPKAAVFDVTDPGNPIYQRAIDLVDGQSSDAAIVNGWAYAAGHDFCTMNVADAAAIRNCVSQGFNEIGLAVQGTTAFTSTSSSDGRIRIFNVSNPAVPVYLREQAIVPGVNFQDVIAYGTDYLVATAPQEPNGVGHDVVVLDRRNLNNLVKVADVNLPNFRAVRGEIAGSTLYLASDGGDAVALIDLTTPSAPTEIARVATGGRTRGLAVSGTSLISADSSTGINVFDISIPSAPAARGRQWVRGNAWDVLVNGSAIYVANETGLVTIRNTGTPWLSSYFGHAPQQQFAALLSRMR